MTPPDASSLQRTWYVDRTPVLRLSLALPHWDTPPRKGHRFNRYYQAQQRAYVTYCQGVLLPMATADYGQCQEQELPFVTHTATMAYTITYQEGDLLSLWTQSQDATGQIRHGDTWDLTSGFPVPLGFFFPHQRHYRKMLANIALADIQRQEASGEAQYHPGLKRRMLQRRFNPRNFYRTQEGLVFFYQRYAIAPGVEGIPCFLHPLTLLE